MNIVNSEAGFVWLQGATSSLFLDICIYTWQKNITEKPDMSD